MSTKLYLTIVAVVAVLYGLAFVLIPAPFLAMYGTPPEPHTMHSAQFFGSALIGLGVVDWFAKDFSDVSAVRSVLIAIVVTTVVGGVIAVWGVVSGVENALGWTSVIVYVLLLAGAAYCLSQGVSKRA